MMRIGLTAGLLIASAAGSCPAYAGDGRAEATIGLIDQEKESNAIGALAVGYDWDLSETVFAGVEASVEQVFANGEDPSLGLAGRMGFKPGEKTKVFVIGGYSFEKEEDRPFVGAGVEQDLAEGIYGVLFYHRLFGDIGPDADVVGVGLGIEF